MEPGTFLCFSDGACRGNPGPGGWGYMVQSDRGNLLHEDNGFLEKTTNNQMELTAAIEALDYVTSVESVQENLASPKVILYSDSKYVLDGLNSWVHGWKSRGWKKADKKPPENLELWQRLDALRGGFAEVRTVWVKGHSGHPQNERCDELANMAIDEAEIW
ncbi:MAG: ribonuclease HI [Bacteriovoracaceae bacterium]